jgi:phospho-N-acetylmuramoyl-pentapeptide-transferase
MGDTGSLAIGGVLAAAAILTKTEMLLPIIGGIFVLEGLSVIVQYSVFRLSGRKRRIFKMAPLHHHFEMSGWQENQIVVRFWIIQFTFAVVGFVLYYFTLYNDAV